LSAALRRIEGVREETRDLLRGAAFLGLVSAARRIEFRRVGETFRIFGDRAARWRLGFVERTNWIRPENMGRVLTGTMRQAARSLRSWGVAFGLGINLASDTARYIEGEYDRHEYSAALTIDTGITIGTALLGGWAAGATSGLVAGMVGGGVALPVVGSVPGAIVGAVVGGVVGLIASVAISSAVDATQVRPALVNRVADLYRGWTCER
jgi:hypothetical protein